MATMVLGLGGPAGYGENVFSTSTLAAGNLDDGSILVDVTSVFGVAGINFFGTSYTGIYLNTNGLITFSSPVTAYTPIAIEGYGSPAIAPFWSDVDINKGGEIYWDRERTSCARRDLVLELCSALPVSFPKTLINGKRLRSGRAEARTDHRFCHATD